MRVGDYSLNHVSALYFRNRGSDNCPVSCSRVATIQINSTFISEIASDPGEPVEVIEGCTLFIENRKDYFYWLQDSRMLKVI